jgi:melibiose permease
MQVIGIIYSFLFFILFFNFFLQLRDYKDEKNRHQRFSIIDTLKLLFTNGKAAALTFSGMFSFSAETFFRVVVSYYFIYVLFSVKTLDAYNWTNVLAAFVGATLALPIAKKSSKKFAYVIGYIIMSASLAGAYLSTGTGITVLPLICICVGIMGLNFARSVMVPMYSDVSDFTRHETGENTTSFFMALYMINFKAAGFVAAQASRLLAHVGFVTGADPTPEVSAGIAKVATLGPAAFALVGALIMLVFYRLNEKEIPKIQAELKEREAASE